MIWATVSSWSCFCWLYRASPSLAAKNIIKLISVLTIWWCPCVVFSCVVGRECLLWPMRSLDKTLLAFALLHSVLQVQTCLLLQVLLDFLLFAFQSPIMKRTPFWGVSSRRSCRYSQNRSTIASSALLVGASTWITVILNGLPWKQTEIILSFFEIASKYCILDYFVDHDGHSISSKGFLPTVVDIMVIWVKFTPSSPF